MKPIPPVFPVYPQETHVPLAYRRYALIAQEILKREGIQDCPVVIEPGKWYVWWHDLNILQKINWYAFKYLGISTIPTDAILGSYLVGKDTRTDEVVSHSIHFVVKRRPGEGRAIDTIVHEVAHALNRGDGHGKKWAKTYAHLRKKYFRNTDIVTDKDGKIAFEI